MRHVYPLKCQLRNEGQVTRVDVYDDIGEGGFFSEGLSAKGFAAQLRGVKGALEVHINSGGGDVFDGIAIGNAIRKHKGAVTTVNDGVAASIASVILQAGQDRVVEPGSMVMVHDAFGLCVGNAAEMAKMTEVLDKNSDNIASIYAERAGGSPADWRATMKNETWYTADEAVEAGLADRVGEGAAALPDGLELAAFESLPGRIAAAMRSLPAVVNADGNHAPLTGTHKHAHPAYGSQGGDAMHSHEHTHGGDSGPDASHSHSHAETAEDRAVRLANAACDPDGDGDDDSTPEGDTDHDYWDADGNQIQDLPGRPMPKKGTLTEQIRAIVREELGIRDAGKYKQDDRDRMAKSGQAMPDGSYPIADEEDLDNAIHAVGRGGADHDAIRRHIIKRAKALGLSEKIPDNWNADGSLQDPGNHATTSVSGVLTPEQIRAALRGATE
jgi:ATP-dependent protease ClpP protease subunit